MFLQNLNVKAIQINKSIFVGKVWDLSTSSSYFNNYPIPITNLSTLYLPSLDASNRFEISSNQPNPVPAASLVELKCNDISPKKDKITSYMWYKDGTFVMTGKEGIFLLKHRFFFIYSFINVKNANQIIIRRRAFLLLKNAGVDIMLKCESWYARWQYLTYIVYLHCDRVCSCFLFV